MVCGGRGYLRIVCGVSGLSSNGVWCPGVIFEWCVMSWGFLCMVCDVQELSADGVWSPMVICGLCVISWGYLCMAHCVMSRSYLRMVCGVSGLSSDGVWCPGVICGWCVKSIDYLQIVCDVLGLSLYGEWSPCCCRMVSCDTTDSVWWSGYLRMMCCAPCSFGWYVVATVSAEKGVRSGVSAEIWWWPVCLLGKGSGKSVCRERLRLMSRWPWCLSLVWYGHDVYEGYTVQYMIAVI
jgi:hypothetical protein